MAFFGFWTKALLYELRRTVHREFFPVWDRDKSSVAHFLPRAARRGRRWPAAQRTSHPGGYFSAREARHGVCDLRNGGGGGSRVGSDDWRLDHGQLQLALD